jgi:Helix-turn-helix.
MALQPLTNRLREHRVKAGLLQRDVASLLQLDCTDRLSRWENGLSYPSIMNLFKLARIYEVMPQQLYPELFESVRLGREENTPDA